VGGFAGRPLTMSSEHQVAVKVQRFGGILRIVAGALDEFGHVGPVILVRGEHDKVRGIQTCF